mmetsp:Transcript_24237/g.45794  ORF Transcript_24237/g.45794 Transcript_24237/m.45794 type:complete len:271 (-) Transcript_24237:18-830(-)
MDAFVSHEVFQPGLGGALLTLLLLVVADLCRRLWKQTRLGKPELVQFALDEALESERVGLPTSRGLRLVCLSDTHGAHRNLKLPDGDVLIHAGDFTQYGREEHAKDFNSWLAEQPHKTKLVVLGNHETNADWNKRVEQLLSSATVLRQSAYELKVSGHEEPVRFFGTDFFWPCAGHNPYFDQIPATTDVLIAHGPAKGCADGEKGCSALFQAVRTIQPKLVISGHIHFARGAALLRHAVDGASTILVNAANCGSGKKERTLVHRPVVIDF